MKLFILICFNFPLILFGQLDTQKIKLQVPVSNEYFAHKEYWRHIEYRDQELRKSPNIEQIDEENLISVIYYYNRFGYPDINRLGDHAKIIPGVWGHNRYSKIDEYTFPLIFAGYKAGTITEPAYREFYLRQLCQRKDDLYPYKTESIEDIHKYLGLRENKNLSIDTVLALLTEYKQIRNDTQIVLGRWIAKVPADTFLVEGKQMITNEQNYKVKLYQVINGKYYIVIEMRDDAIEPVELTPTDNMFTRFIISGKRSSKYYLIAENGKLLYTDDTKRIYKSYVASR